VGSRGKAPGAGIREKGKEEYLYSAFLAKVVHSKHSGMDHTVYLQITPCLPFLWERSPDVTTTATEAVDIQLFNTAKFG